MARASSIFTTSDARRLARRRLPWMVFDYIDGATGEEHGKNLNRAAMLDLRLRARVLVNVANRSVRSRVFGRETALPFGISPMGMCNLSRPGADLMLARLAARHCVPLGVSTVCSTPMETILETAEGNAWFQLYVSGDGSNALALVDRAEASGYETLVLTVDVPEVGRRPRELRHGFKTPFRIGPRQFLDFALHPQWSLATLAAGAPTLANFSDGAIKFDRGASRAEADWGFFERLRERWRGNLVVKGVLDRDDAIRLKASGADAIQVSSHGGRQLDSAIPPILALRAIRDAVGPDFPLFYDSGIRGGEDIVKAYACGADFVFLGRAALYAIAAAGEDGLNRLVDILTEEVDLTLAQIGKTRLVAMQDVLA